MRIAIVGSWKTENVDSWSLSDEAGFAEACQTVGAEIARQGHRLVVGSDSARTADYKAVEGVVQVLGDLT